MHLDPCSGRGMRWTGLIQNEYFPRCFRSDFLVIFLDRTLSHVHQHQQRARSSRRRQRQPHTGRGESSQGRIAWAKEPHSFTVPDLLLHACIVRAISEFTFELRLRGIFCATMMGQRGGWLWKDSRRQKIGMSVEEQHVQSRHVQSRGCGEGQERKRAGQSKRGEDHLLPRQQALRLARGAYWLILIFVFHISLRGWLSWLMYWCFYVRIVSFVTEEFTAIVRFQGTYNTVWFLFRVG